ncbi:MAG: hypothetical protein M3Z84_02285 [Actinomycetota bacterium]|nr:hypothetical protein [Actinomycetota bacterium]
MALGSERAKGGGRDRRCCKQVSENPHLVVALHDLLAGDHEAGYGVEGGLPDTGKIATDGDRGKGDLGPGKAPAGLVGRRDPNRDQQDGAHRHRLMRGSSAQARQGQHHERPDQDDCSDG